LLGILDKATLTLGDNSRVDLSQTVIFLTSEEQHAFHAQTHFAASIPMELAIVQAGVTVCSF
jgi:hypothetical protein